MIEYHLQGLSVRDIAKKVRVSKTTVQTYITKYRNNELLQLNLFSEENLKKKIHTSVSSQSRQKFYRPQEHHTYNINQKPKQIEPYYLENNQEYKLRERENQKDEQARKSNQEAQEKLHQLKMKSYLMQQETEQQKQQKTSDFLQKLDQDKIKFKNEQSKKAIESYEKTMARIRDIEEHNQQLIDYIPMLVRKEMNKFQVLQQAREDEIQRDKDEHLESTFPQLKQAEVNVNTESDYSDILEGFVYGGIPVICKSIRFHLSQDNNIPISSPEYWIRLSKYLKDDRKRET